MWLVRFENRIPQLRPVLRGPVRLGHYEKVQQGSRNCSGLLVCLWVESQKESEAYQVYIKTPKDHLAQFSRVLTGEKL